MPTARPKTSRASKKPVTRGVRVGGRSQRVVSAVLRAAAFELARHGYVEFQIEEVAREAGVNRTSIYRRWPTKALLVEAALREINPWRHSHTASGDLQRDLLEMLTLMLRWLSTTQGKSILRMVQPETVQPELASIIKGLQTESLRPWTTAIDAAKARGEVARNLDSRLLSQMILAPTMARLEHDEPLDKATLSAIVRVVLAGARPTASATKAAKRKRVTS